MVRVVDTDGLEPLERGPGRTEMVFALDTFQRRLQSATSSGLAACSMTV
jgi:hypothetical protein